MAANGQLVFTDVDKVTFKGVGGASNAVIDTTTGKIGVGVDSPDANLHVLGNCFVSTNFELGGTMTMGTVTVRAQHELSAITATGNTTPHTVEFQNAETGLVTTGNVSVGKDLTVSGNVAVDTDTLFVDSVNDRVGVGTTIPSHALTVAAASGDAEVHIQAQGNDGGDAILYFNGSPTNQRKCAIISSNVAPNAYCKQDLHFCMETTDDLTDVDITDSKMVITNGGNVGIGVTDPDTTLEVKFPSNDGSQPILSLIRDGTMSSTVGATFRAIDIKTQQIGGYSPVTHASINLVNYNPSGTGQFGLSQPDRQDTGLGFSVIHDGSTVENALVISSIGNVGIGTTLPQAPFHVKPVNNNNDAENTLLDFRGDFSNHGYLGIFATETHTNAIGPDLRFKGAIYNNTANPTINQVMCLKPTGKVGIGTTSPLGTLHVQTEARSGTEGSGNGIYVTSGCAEYSNGSEFRHSNQSQGVGIGYAGIYATGYNTNQDLSIVSRGTGITYVKNYQVFSDDRVKMNEEYVTNATETLLKLKPQIYDKHEEIGVLSDTPLREAGLIAQDIYYDTPELRYLVSARNKGIDAEPVNIPQEKPFVDDDPANDPDYSSWGTAPASVAYIQLIPYLIKSNQELHARIQALENVS